MAGEYNNNSRNFANENKLGKKDYHRRDAWEQSKVATY
jgi:hypothetical protein